MLRFAGIIPNETATAVLDTLNLTSVSETPTQRYYRTHKEECAERTRSWKQRNPERARAWRIAYRAKNYDRLRAYEKSRRGKYAARRRELDRARRLSDPIGWAQANRAWFLKNADKRLDYQLRAKYGITRADYDALLARQGAVCAICRLPPPVLRKERTIRRLWVDHSHGNGAVRGLLCNSCNSLIGLAKEDPVILQAAIAYLAR